MYKKILIPLDNSSVDQAILDHIKPLAKLAKASLILIHVADGYAARLKDQLNLEDSQEIKEDRNYLENKSNQLQQEGFSVETYLPLGDPADEILKIAKAENVDLIAMATHGHRFVKDLILGSVADKIRHNTNIPILMLKG